MPPSPAPASSTTPPTASSFASSGAPKDRIEFQQTAAGWSYVLTEAVVDAYIARAAARAAAAPH